MEAVGVLDPSSDVDIFVLHCIYLPRIKKSLVEFSGAWNHHPLRTERNWSPQQIMDNSLIRETDLASNIDISPSDYGVDPDGPFAAEEVGTVQVPETLAPIDDDDLEQFISVVDSSSYFDDFGFQHYVDCRQFLLSMMYLRSYNLFGPYNIIMMV